MVPEPRVWADVGLRPGTETLTTITTILSFNTSFVTQKNLFSGFLCVIYTLAYLKYFLKHLSLVKWYETIK